VTVDERLRDALRRRADAVIPSQPEWSRVAGRFTPPPRRYRRLAVPSVVGAVVVVVAAVLISIHSGSDGPRAIGTAGLPASSTVPAPSTPLAAEPTTTLAPAPTTTAAPRADVPVVEGFGPTGVTWVSPLQGWVIGTGACGPAQCAALLHTVDGGASWTRVPNLTGDPTFRGVRFADERNGWVFGLSAYATHDGGATWRLLNPPFGKVASLEAAGGRAWAIVQTGEVTSQPYLFTSSVGSDDWQQVGSEPAPGSALALQGATGYVVGIDGVVRALSAAGLEPRGAPCGDRGGLLAVTGTNVFALCTSAPAAGSSTKTLMLSTDGARTWSPVGSPPFGGVTISIAAASPSTIVVAAGGGAPLLYLSQDGGRTWTTVYQDASLGGTGFHDLGFTTASRGVAVVGSQFGGTGSRLLVTSDAGRTWSPVTIRP
jgi:photosystem II stability/assembly factor-like uncharacterized protein